MSQSDFLASGVAPSIILVRPQMGENIGASARAMLNFGLDRMRVVAARDGWPNQKAVAMASGAGRVLDDAQHVDDLPAALGDVQYSYATTARARDLSKTVFTPEGAAKDALRRIAAGQKVSFVFGPERSGLENEDIAHCNALITVPVNPEYGSLNLAQCVLLVAYEFRRQALAAPDAVFDAEKSEFANAAEITAMANHYEERLDEAGFFWPEEKAQSMRINLRNLWSRLELTRADVQMLHGIMRQMVRWKDRGNSR